MVRKRSRKYDSDENDSSDSDIDYEFEAKSKPAPKRYSLRERKRTSATTTDFDYYGLGLDEDEAEPAKQSSDDEDFEVDEEEIGGHYLAEPNGVGTYFEPDPEMNADPENSEGLIDFEDIIRADIVVNKNKIDYDNLIHKTEIKLNPAPNKRGRKPKTYSKDDSLKQEPDDGSTSLPENLDQLKEDPENKEDSQNGDDFKALLQPEVTFSEGTEELPKCNVLERLENGGAALEQENRTPPAEEIGGTEAVVCEKRIESVESESSKKQESSKKETHSSEDEDDDVIVLEVKQDVIVLDD